MKWTKKQLEDFESIFDEVKDKLEDIIGEDAVEKGKFQGQELLNFEVLLGVINFKTQTWYQGCDPDHYYHSISIDDLLNKTPEEIFAERLAERESEIAKRKEAEEKHKAEEKVKFAKRKEEQDLRDYKRLKKKFAGKKS